MLYDLFADPRDIILPRDIEGFKLFLGLQLFLVAVEGDHASPH